MKSNPKVSIVILNWNKPDLTIESLESVGGLQIVDYRLHVIVVDNGSTDDSVKKIESYFSAHKSQFADHSLIENEENLGFAEGNNVGIRYAIDKSADYVLVLNNDTTVHNNLVVELIKVANNNPKAGIISPKIYFSKGFEFHKKRYKAPELGKVIWAAGGDIDWENIYGTNHGVDEVDKGQFDKMREIDFASGACLFCRIEFLKEVGTFDKRYYMYLEDVELSQRAKKRGWEVILAPKAILWHKVAQSSKIGGELNDYFIARNRMMFGVGIYGNGYAKFRTKISLTKEALRLLVSGRKWQKKGIRDFYLLRFGRGSWK